MGSSLLVPAVVGSSNPNCIKEAIQVRLSGACSLWPCTHSQSDLNMYDPVPAATPAFFGFGAARYLGELYRKSGKRHCLHPDYIFERSAAL